MTSIRAFGLSLAVLLAACGAPDMPDDFGEEPDASVATSDAASTPDAADLAPDADLPADAGMPADSGMLPDGGGMPADAAVSPFVPPPTIPKDVVRGDKGLPVGDLQFQLKLATGKYLDEDGLFGNGTLSVLNTFQMSAGITTSNVADSATRAALGTKARDAAAALIRTYPPNVPSSVPPLSEVKANVAAVKVVPGQGDKTGTYNGRVGFAWGDGAESTSIRQGSPAHLDWIASLDLSPSERRVIGVISRNEGPFDAVNSYDAGDYTWGAYQLIGSYRASTYNPSEDELSQGLAYMKRLDPASFHENFQRYGLDVTGTFNSGVLVRSSVKVSLLLTDGTTLTGKSVWQKVGTTEVYNQIFINAGADPRIQRTEVLSAKSVHFDALGLPLATGKANADRYLTSERAVCAFLDMELNVGRRGAQNVYSASVDAVASKRSLDGAKPDGWPEIDRTQIEKDILQEALSRAPSTRYATRMQRVLSSVFIDDAARSFVPLK